MSETLIVAVESDTAACESLSRELNKRYGEDYEIHMFADPVRALDALGKHQASGEWKGQPVCVVGGGNSTGQAAVYLARYARQVTILVRGESLASSSPSICLPR